MAKVKPYKYEPDYAVPPGETIEELMGCCDVSLTTLALCLGMKNGRAQAEGLLKGDEPITEKMARTLEALLGPPARFWLNRERNYRETLQRLKGK